MNATKSLPTSTVLPTPEGEENDADKDHDAHEQIRKDHKDEPQLLQEVWMIRYLKMFCLLNKWACAQQNQNGMRCISFWKFFPKME